MLATPLARLLRSNAMSLRSGKENDYYREHRGGPHLVFTLMAYLSVRSPTLSPLQTRS